ncbi:hypothetical protein TNCV_2248041 [Trichonephila clavipes]|nr:hypothetical protein TNCV_2248041 [Trichonephila clavipes]
MVQKPRLFGVIAKTTTEGMMSNGMKRVNKSSQGVGHITAGNNERDCSICSNKSSVLVTSAKALEIRAVVCSTVATDVSCTSGFRRRNPGDWYLRSVDAKQQVRRIQYSTQNMKYAGGLESARGGLDSDWPRTVVEKCAGAPSSMNHIFWCAEVGTICRHSWRASCRNI